MEALIIQLLPLLIQIESSGNDKAIGDKGLARGCLQIHRGYWQDGCERLKVDWNYEEGSFDRVKSIKVAYAYLVRYGKAYEKLTGKKATPEVLARIHNGGPLGWKKDATKKYWLKVKKLLDNKDDKQYNTQNKKKEKKHERTRKNNGSIGKQNTA